VFESLFTFLFKYQPLVFEQGTFVFWATRSMWLVAATAAAAALYALWTYRRLAFLAGRGRATLLTLRIALFAVVVFALLRPTLQLKVAVPQQNFVGVLLDDSRSMQVADLEGHPRGNYVTENFGGATSPLLAKLSEKFVVRTYRFSSFTERLNAPSDLSFNGTGTQLGAALSRAKDELAGLPLSGLIVVSDGADTSEATLDTSITELKAENIPVFTVGVGEEKMARDIQVSRVETPRQALKGSFLVVDVVITQTGFEGQTLPLVVESEGRVVDTQDIPMPDDGEAKTVRVRFKVDEGGLRRF
jgi:hypothetical protein